MKRNNIYLLITLLSILLSCNSDEKVNGNGFVRIGIITNTSVITKAEGDVEIKNIRLVISNVTENSSDKDWSKEYNFAPDAPSEDIELAPGNYKLVAIASNGSEVADGFTPAYMGEAMVEVTAGNTSTARIECKLTTVKVSVEYASSVVGTYQTEYKTVVGGVAFSGEEKRAGYIAPGNLSVDFMFKDNAGSWQTISLDKIAEAKAQEYYKIKISMKSTEGEGDGSSEGAANISIQVGEENPRDIEVGIVLPKVVVTTLDAENVLTNSATLKGKYVSPSGKVTPSNPKFFYRKKGVTEWQNSISASSSDVNTQYLASLIGLDDDTEYEYKFMEKGNSVDFKTKVGDKTLEKKAIGVTVAYVYGELNTNAVDAYFEYILASETDWSHATKVLAVLDTEGNYKAELTGLSANQSYQYRFMESKVIQTLTTCSSISIQSVTAGADYAKVKWNIQSSKNLLDTDEVIVSYKYKKQGDSWGEVQSLVIEMQENGNKNIITGLEQNGTYCIDDENKTFTTLKNASFDTWFKGSNKAWYANEKDSYDFWATGNEGVRKASKDSNTEPIEGRDGVKEHAAKLTSINAKILMFGFFAAGNLYTGSFNFTSLSDAMNADKAKKFPKFGQSFSTRPTGLNGWYKYTSTNIDQGLDKSDSRYGMKDKCQIYVKLFTGDQYDASTINSTTYIAEGEYSSDEDVTEWTPFELDLTYHDSENIPTRIAIVATSSIYGGDFIGALNSILYVDDFELVYDYTKSPYIN